ncbi:hypothetical protein GCM10011495_01630 [Hymenobacter frigidus]|jgi:hypothetical protein|uniref:Translation initiation factor 2 n=1 Tax=Hymenobacter frigidus TaxID=1524095 RepID=A0ABQ1ZV71_9BACT|nr:hypothetical protein [Hymenobacter frigidus]GGH78819.1 hypothetical protein GCM10011495_01630 [Hymenobacter frigidus]
MKNLVSPFAKLIAVAACALTLGSCSRSEYAMLPKGGSYHGVTRVSTPVPATAETVAAPAAAATAAETRPAAAPVVAVAPVTKAPAAAKTPAAVLESPAAAATVAAAPAPKLNLVQRMALGKVTHKMEKMVQKSGSVRQHDNTASTSKTAAISGNLRIGIILLLVGLLVGLINGLIGGIIAIIGLIFIVLWLLDQM